MSNGTKQTLTMQLGVTRFDLTADLVSFSDTQTRTNERIPGPGQNTYRDTKHRTRTVSFELDDTPATRPLMALAGEVATVTYDEEPGVSDTTIVQINPMVTVNAAGGGSVTYSVTGDVLR